MEVNEDFFYFILGGGALTFNHLQFAPLEYLSYEFLIPVTLR
jgi:hypothetical protein